MLNYYGGQIIKKLLITKRDVVPLDILHSQVGSGGYFPTITPLTGLLMIVPISRFNT